MREILGDRLLPDWAVMAPKAFNYVAPEGAPDATTDPLEAISGGWELVVAFRDPGSALTAGGIEQAFSDDFPFWVKEDGKDVPYKPADKSAERKVVVRPEAGAGGAGIAAFPRVDEDDDLDRVVAAAHAGGDAPAHRAIPRAATSSRRGSSATWPTRRRRRRSTRSS